MATTPTSAGLAPAPQSTALATAFNTRSHEASAVTALLERAGRECHLVAPATSCGSLPEGCGGSRPSAILVNLEAETYPIAGGDGDDGKGGAEARTEQGGPAPHRERRGRELGSPDEARAPRRRAHAATTGTTSPSAACPSFEWPGDH